MPAPAPEPAGHTLSEPEPVHVPPTGNSGRAARPIEVTLRSSPTGAPAAVDGTVVGTTPAYWGGDADGHEHEFTFDLKGFALARYRFVPVTSGVIHARLEPLAEETDAGVSPESAAPGAGAVLVNPPPAAHAVERLRRIARLDVARHPALDRVDVERRLRVGIAGDDHGLLGVQLERQRVRHERAIVGVVRGDGFRRHDAIRRIDEAGIEGRLAEAVARRTRDLAAADLEVNPDEAAELWMLAECLLKALVRGGLQLQAQQRIEQLLVERARADRARLRDMDLRRERRIGRRDRARERPAAGDRVVARARARAHRRAPAA